MATQAPEQPRSARPARAVPVRKHRPPVMGDTQYDVVRSLMLACVLLLIAAVVWLAASYVAPVRTDVEDRVQLEMVELAGGSEDGAIDETLKVESPEEEVPDASLNESETEEVTVEETIETVLDVSDQASEMSPQQVVSTNNSGKAGSASGTGRRAFGKGSGSGGMPREQRWYVRFSDGTLDTYAKQLDFFKIELGLLTPDGKLTYVTNVSQANPTKRTVSSGAGEKRLYMTWQGGNRKSADLELFKKAGINASRGTIFHFYPKNVEQDLMRVEYEFRNKKASQIRRTYFVVQGSRSGFNFAVSRQTYN